MTTPTLNKLIRVYKDYARIERLKCGRPSEGTVRNTMAGLRMFLRWINEKRRVKGLDPFAEVNCEVRSAGRNAVEVPDADVDFDRYDPGSPLVSIVTPQLIHRYLSDLLKRNIRPVTAMTYVNQLRQLFAKWAMAYYDDFGWKVPEFPRFGKRPASPRYSRPSPEKIAKVKEWYLGLEPGELWFVVTMMLEFGMRNGDIVRLKRENFTERDGRLFLNYIPNKTRHSSARIVKWPVHPLLWEKIARSGAVTGSAEGGVGKAGEVWDLPEIGDETFRELNRKMRSFGFTGTKGAYELRKICIDHIYQRYGAEMAVSISGDSIRTIMHYYADPSQPNAGEVRVVDLL